MQACSEMYSLLLFLFAQRTKEYSILPVAVPLFHPLPGVFKTALRIRRYERASAENFDNPFPRQPLYQRFWR